LPRTNSAFDAWYAGAKGLYGGATTMMVSFFAHRKEGYIYQDRDSSTETPDIRKTTVIIEFSSSDNSEYNKIIPEKRNSTSRQRPILLPYLKYLFDMISLSKNISASFNHGIFIAWKMLDQLQDVKLF
jgi:hypothetical protein